MSYSLVIARRRIEALERRPSALKPMLIRGGIPANYRAPPPGSKPKTKSINRQKASSATGNRPNS